MYIFRANSTQKTLLECAAELKKFDCGIEALNEFLSRYSVKNDALGIGKWLLTQAFIKIVHVSEITGLYFIIVDVKESSKSFYEHYGFIKFTDKDFTYFLPVETVRKAMEG